MHAYPDEKAETPAQCLPEVAALLRSVDNLPRFERIQRMSRLEAYYRGCQYDDRPYNWDGSWADDTVSAEAVGVPQFPSGYVPVRHRKPPVEVKLGRKIVHARTSMVFAGGFPEVNVDGDEDTADFLRAVVVAAKIPKKARQHRNLGGAMGAVAVSYGWKRGLPFVEVHSAKLLHVLAWEDRAERIPRHVVKVWCATERGVDAEGRYVEGMVWYAREWLGPAPADEFSMTEAGPAEALGVERVYRYFDRTKTEPPRWVVLSEGPLYECPVVWTDNVDADEREDGEGDFEGMEGTIDEANVVLGATTGGTARNVDPTLVVKLDPAMNPGKLRKGDHNTIFAPGGAEYLQLASDGVKAGLDTFSALKSLGLEQADVTEFDPEKMTGAAQSGEALRRLMQPFIAVCDGLRENYGEAWVRVLRGLWRLAIYLLAAPEQDVPLLDATGKPVVGPDGAVRTQRVRFELRLPPRVERDPSNGEIAETEDRVPGKGGDVSLTWHDYVAMTAQDKQMVATLIGTALGGKAFIQLRTAVKAAKNLDLLPIEDIDEEVEAIVDDTERIADANAGSLGMLAGGGPKPGAAPKKSKED